MKPIRRMERTVVMDTPPDLRRELKLPQMDTQPPLGWIMFFLRASCQAAAELVYTCECGSRVISTVARRWLPHTCQRPSVLLGRCRAARSSRTIPRRLLWYRARRRCVRPDPSAACPSAPGTAAEIPSCNSEYTVPAEGRYRAARD